MGALIALWVVMYFTIQISWLLTIPIAIIAGGLVVRTFIIFHDCGHGSFLKSKRANNIVGYWAGVLTLTSYKHWRWEHAQHHASSGDLDRPSPGEVWMMTVQQYDESPKLTRIAYRIFRNPVVLFGIIPVILFAVRERFWSKGAKKNEIISILLTNLGIAVAVAALIWIFGFWNYFFIHLTITTVAATSGVWLFYVQHQFEGAYFERHHHWDYTSAALIGSSFYKLHPILQWFTGNIGFHHVHHLSSKIPNYNLEACHNSHELFRAVKPLTFFSSLKYGSYRLWDEDQKKLVGFKRVREYRTEKKENKLLEAMASKLEDATKPVRPAIPTQS
ncbi:UNVERIFIED_CONTAM: hypothetical protein GTU68_059735 [Idotea baltica]|nr:hypothetical protein [Idotea baltica]